MKKLYTTPEYKEWNKRRILKSLRRRSAKKIHVQVFGEKKEKRKHNWKNENRKQSFNNVLPIIAPSDFRLFSNTAACLLFFRSIRDPENVNHIRNIRFIRISLLNVEEIDYGTISALTAISDDLKFKGITLQGNFPKNADCRKFIIDSGFLNHMYDGKNHRFPKAEKSDLIFFEKGCGSLSTEDNKKISQLIKNVIFHIAGESKYCPPIKTVLLEICGNSIEHASTENKQWLLGVKYEVGKVIFTVTDVGKGILETLHRKFGRQFTDFFKNRSNLDILVRAFEQKYGSSTLEANRNKGLPAVKANSESGIIQSLRVLTNNVILDFNDNNFSKTFASGAPRFRGTIYQWELTKDCIDKITTK
jgi:hypothetical protein